MNSDEKKFVEILSKFQDKKVDITVITRAGKSFRGDILEFSTEWIKLSNGSTACVVLVSQLDMILYNPSGEEDES